MLRKQLGTLILVTCFILTTVPTVLGTPGVSEVYIVGNWSGDFNDGEDNYAQINQTLETDWITAENLTSNDNQTTTNKTAVMENMLEQEVETNISFAEDTSVTDESQTMVNDTIPTDSIEQETKNATTVNDQINATEVSFNNTTVIEPALEQGFETGIEADSITENRLKEAAPNTAYKEKSYIDLGDRPGIGKYRELLLFDLSKYSDAKNISSATLSLYWFYPDGKERPKDTVMEVYRPAAAWSPENVTWNSRDRDNDVLWIQPGGDWYDKNGILQGNTPYATLTLKGNTLPDNRYYELDVTELVKEYVSRKYENTGFLIKTRTENADYVAFYSSDAEDEKQHPKLNIEQT